MSVIVSWRSLVLRRMFIGIIILLFRIQPLMNRPLPYLNRFVKREQQDGTSSRVKDGDQASEINLKKALAKKKSLEEQQVIRLRKEVEDSSYLVTKVKEERNDALIRIEKLEKELSQVNDKMIKDLAKLRGYMAKRIQMRESIYKQEIQTLATSFNRNYQFNMAMIQNLVNEKFDYEDQIRDLKQSNQEFITKQSQNFENLISEMEKHKLAVDEELKDSNQKLHEREDTITQLNDEIDRLNEELEQLRNSYKTLQENKQDEQQKLTNAINELNIKLTQNEGLIHEQTLMIERITSENAIKEDQMTSLSNLVADHVKDKNELHTQNMKLIDAREDLIHNNQILTMKNEQLQQELKQLHGQVQKMRLQYDQLTSKYRSDLDQRHETFNKELAAERDQNMTLSQRLQQLFHEKEMMSLKVAELQGISLQKDDEIDIFKKELEHNKKLAQQLTKEMTDNVQKFKQHQNQLTEKLSEYIQRSNQLQNENTQLNGQIRELNITTQEELMKMKEEYEILSESNKRLFEDEIQMLRKGKDQDELMASNMRNEYEQEINSMMDSHRNEIQELERVYRQDSDRKDGQIYQALQEKNNLFEEFQAFKFKVQMEEAEKDHEIELLKINKGMFKKSKMSEIEELENQEEIEKIQSEEDEEEEVIPVKKMKKTKAIKIESLSEKQAQSEKFLDASQFQDGQQDEVSVFQLLKNKKSNKSPKKGKLKLRKSQRQEEQEEVAAESFDLSKDIEENPPKQTSQEEEEEEIEEPITKPKSKSKPKSKFAINKKEQVASPTKKQKKQSKGIDIDQILAQKAELQERILQLQQLNDTLQFGQKTMKSKFERQEKKYQNKIKVLQEQIKALNGQIQQLFLKINEQDSKFADSYKKESEKKKKELEVQQANRKTREEEDEKKIKIEQGLKKQREKSLKEPASPRSITSKKSRKILKHDEPSEDEAHKSRLKQKPVDQEKYKQKIQNLQEMLIDKQKKMEKIQEENRDLNREIQKVKSQANQKTGMLQSKYLQQDRTPHNLLVQPSFPQASFGADSFMKQSIANLQDKVSSEKQKYSDLKIKFDQKHRENEQLVFEVRKLKTAINQLEDKDKKRQIPRSMQEMQSQIEDGNKKILELSRSVNQARLERDSFQDQIRIVRKKLLEISKTNQDSEARASENERETEDLRRKEQKFKRQIQQYQQDIKRIKETNRKTLEELSEVRKSQSEYVIERKKVLDEVIRLQGVLAQKETDIMKLNKEMEKLKSKINDTTEGKQGRQREYRSEMQKLQVERSKMDRKNREQEETIKILKQKLDVLEKQAKKLSQQRKQTYSEKLKSYINQIAGIKEIVEEYQQQNSQLKLQNSQFFDQNELLKSSFEKLEIKYEEETDRSSHLQETLKAAQQKITELEDNLKKNSSEQQKTKIVLSSLRKELDNQRLVGRKKTEKCQQLQQINQRCLYDIKMLRLRLNDFQVETDDKNKLAQQLYTSQRTIGSLQEQLNRISEQHNMYSERYIYTLQDVEKAIRQIKQHEDRVKEEQMTKIIQELDSTNSSNRQNMEKQLLTLYNQNEKLRVGMHKANQDYLQLQLQMAEVENLRDKAKRLQKDKSSCDRRVMELSDELKAARQQIRRLQIKFNESIRNQESKTTQSVILLQKYEDLSKKYQDLNETHLELKQDDKKLLQKYKTANDEKDQTIQKLSNQIQVFNNKLLANQLQINRLKEIESMSSQDYFKNKKKLENQIQEISNSFKLKEKDAEIVFKTQLRDLKTKNTKFEEQLDQKTRRIEELQEGLFMLQNQIQELTSELTDSRAQLAEEGELYTLEINKLRNQMRQNQEAYDNNLRNLEEELSAMSKQLTTLKYARENFNNNSRLRMSRQSENCDERGNRKFEEKIKLKDRRIEELKETIIAYEQKMTLLTVNTNRSEETEFLKQQLAGSQAEWKQALDKKTKELNDLSLLFKKTSEESQKYKMRQQQLTLLLEQKDLEISSIKSQLTTIKILYTDLQKEIDKRKESLNREFQETSGIKLQLQTLTKEITIRNQQISMLTQRIQNNEVTLKKKSQQIRNNLQNISDLQRERTLLLDQQRKKLQGESFAKLKITEIQSQNSNLKTDNRRLRNELNIITKQNDGLKSDLNQKSLTLIDLLKEVQNNDKIISQNQILLSKYVTLNQECLTKTGISLDLLINRVVELKGSTEQKDDEIERLKEELEELTFLSENKYVALEELKRQNYDLHLKDQERQTCLLRLDELKEQLILHQNQRQELIFRYEAFKVQLASIDSKLGENKDIDWVDVKRKINNLLTDNYI